MITPAQRSRFFPAMHAAWREHCRLSGGDANDIHAREAWYRDQLAEVLTVRSLQQVNHTDDFDRIMLHWAEVAGDDRAIAYFCDSLERRYRYIVGNMLVNLSIMEGRDLGWEYVEHVYQHMGHGGWPSRIEDAPAKLLQKVIAALDTHIRRLQRREVEHGPA